MSRHQNQSWSMIWFLGCLLAVGILSACSGASSDEESLDAGSGENGGDMGKDDAAEGNGQENFVDANNSGSAGADVNSDTSGGGDELGAAQSASSGNPATSNPVNGGANSAPTGGNNAMFGNADASASNPPVTDSPTNPSANAALANTPADNSQANAALPATNSVPANASAITQVSTSSPSPQPTAQSGSVPSGLAPRSDGRVRYVKEGGVQIVNAPNGSPVANLEQGDHPVTWEENGWLKIADGMYVPVDGLSNRGVGRPKAARVWGQ